jgi:hypothetical protein
MKTPGARHLSAKGLRAEDDPPEEEEEEWAGKIFASGRESGPMNLSVQAVSTWTGSRPISDRPADPAGWLQAVLI